MNKKTARKLRKYADGDPQVYERMKREWNKSSKPQKVMAMRVITHQEINRAKFKPHGN